MSANPESNGERPAWFDIEVSTVPDAIITKTSSTIVGDVLEDIRSGRWEVPVEWVRERYSKALEKAKTEGILDPVEVAKMAVRGDKKSCPGCFGAERSRSGPMPIS